MHANNLVKSAAVMAFFGYTNRAAFWHFVKTKGVPCIFLNARRVMFDPVALNNWIRSRSSDPDSARLFVFDAPSALVEAPAPAQEPAPVTPFPTAAAG